LDDVLILAQHFILSQSFLLQALHLHTTHNTHPVIGISLPISFFTFSLQDSQRNLGSSPQVSGK
jgi:hypothetical protein